MNKNKEYTRDEMLKWLEREFKEERKYRVETYSDDYLPARVPLYCKKEKGGKITDEVVIEVTTNKIIKKEDFFPSLPVNKRGKKVELSEVSAVRFYRYYFPKARIFFAYPDYVEENDEFKEFKKVCSKIGIGLLKTSGRVIVEEKEAIPRSLFDEICKQLVNNKDSPADIRNIVEDCLENYLDYLVYYAAPEYKRRAIIGRTEGDISLVLMDELAKLKNIAFKEELKNLASGYRQEDRDDYRIALETIKKLWSGKDVQDTNYSGIGVEYPEIQRLLEDILLRNPEYRDHFLHQFQVFLLGACIIDRLYGNEKCIEEFEHQYKCPIEKAWVLTSTYHDFNYSIQEYDLWIKEFLNQALNTSGNLSSLKLGAAFIRENFLLKTGEICAALNLKMGHIVMNFFYEQATAKRNHGLLSALSLLKLFENTPSKDIDHSALVQSAMAIALHDEDIWKAFSGKGEKKEKKWSLDFTKKRFLRNLEFQKNPLAFLLIFCDTIQEWGRVGRNYEKSEPWLEDVMLGTNKTGVTLSVKHDSFWNRKTDEIARVAKFLKDKRFVIELKSRASGKITNIPMAGVSN